MITVVDARFRDEASRFELRYGCQHCAHFDEPGRRCSWGYPTEKHLAGDLATTSELVFCKTFELG